MINNHPFRSLFFLETNTHEYNLIVTNNLFGGLFVDLLDFCVVVIVQ